ncbi:MAG: AmmeMemoRadiSam system protein A [Verrucomicrobiota bacterium]
MNTAEQDQLLRWARRAIEQAVRGEKSAPVVGLTDNLCTPHAAFVTLKKHGELRGCIGHMDFARPLWQNVVGAAVASALEDSRFTPVVPAELPELRLEISMLERPVDLPRIAEFDAQRQGIIIQRGMRRALLLPKVAQEYGWSAEQVLACVCQKAGLPADAWREPETRFQVFTAFDFGEPEVED